MLTQTSELAIRTLVFLGLEGDGKPQPPRQISEKLDCSQSYLAKVLGMLVRSGILKSVRGAHGGVLLARLPDQITLLDVVESCQGLLIGNYCEEISTHKDPVCAFHQAMREIHKVTIDTLSKWSLRDLMSRPTPTDPNNSPFCCKMNFAGCEKYSPATK